MTVEGLRAMFGPSPRGWGNRVRHAGRPSVERAIPTRVGKSLELEFALTQAAGHPHAGGEISCY